MAFGPRLAIQDKLLVRWSAWAFVFLVVASAFPQSAPKSVTSDFPPDQNPRYFPVGVFAEEKSDGSFSARWYATQLRALREPSLSGDPQTNAEPVYRFTGLRSSHHPIAVRAGGYGPGKLVANTSKEVGVKEVRHLFDLIQTMEFSLMPSEPAPEPNMVHLDGAQWILEASIHGDYHVIDRWSPENGPLRELGLYLTRTLARLNVPTAQQTGLSMRSLIVGAIEQAYVQPKKGTRVTGPMITGKGKLGPRFPTDENPHDLVFS